MEIDKLTIGEVKQIRSLISFGDNTELTDDHPYPIGVPVLIQTVTLYVSGVIVEVGSQEIVIKQAAWIADTGRFSDTLKTAEFSEVEPFPDGCVLVGRGAIITVCGIKKAPRNRK